MMFDDLIQLGDEVHIRTNVDSDVFGRLVQVDNGKRMFIVKPGDGEGRYLVPFDAVLCIRIDHAVPQQLAS